jgi:hypothetical protein
MALKKETHDILRSLERSANKKLRYPEVIGELVESAVKNGLTAKLLDAAFLAKFVTRSMGVMQRIGVNGDGYDKLREESEANLAKASSLVRSFVDHLPPESRLRNDALFFALSHDSMRRFVGLLEDLTVLKNWSLDGGKLPGAFDQRNPE